MTFLQSSYLWGLLAMAVPIAIHLWSRKKVRTIKVGSTQFIAETKSKQSKSVQLNEWWLLVLRCSIISMVVFVLSEPRISKTPDQQEIAYVFEPSLLATDEGRALFTQIPEEGRRLLISGFPEWQATDEIVESDKAPNYWQLARQMKQIPADSIVVFTRAFAKAVKGSRPEVRENINWIPVPLEAPVSKPLVAIVKKDSIEVLNVHSDANRLAYSKTYVPIKELSLDRSKDSVEITMENRLQTLPIQNQKSILITIVYTKAEDAQRIYFEAAFRAIRKYTNRDIQLNIIEDSENITIEDSDYLIILGNQQVFKTETPTLLYRPDTLARKLIEPGRTVTEYFLTSKLTPQNIVEEHLVEQILNWLQLDQEIVDNLNAVDRRTVSRNQLNTNFSTERKAAKKIVVADISGGLWIIILLLLFGERILARIRKQ